MHPEKTLLPKFEFLLSIGVSKSGLSTLVSRNPDLLARSLERFLIPTYEILKSLLDSDKKVVVTLNRMKNRSLSFLQKRFSNNLSTLRGRGISQSSISYLVTQSPLTMSYEMGKFAEGIEKVMKLGFDPSKAVFLDAFRVLLGVSHKTWEHKIEVYRKLGFSENEISTSFRKFPKCMVLSDKKLIGIMDFLVCKMGWQPADVARVPTVLGYSLEKRIMPRCSIVRVLVLKGLIKEDIRLSTVLIPSEKLFLKRFMIKYQEHVPQLLDIFQNQMEVAELGSRISGFENV